MKKQLLACFSVLALIAGMLVPMAAFAQEYIPLTPDEQIMVALAVGESKWYQFTPETSGPYSFLSSDEIGVDPVASLYNSSMEMIAQIDDSNGANFEIQYDLIAGETYYLEAYEFNYDNEGSYMLKVTQSLPTDVFFDEYHVNSFVGQEYTVTAHVYPENTNDTLLWTSSDETVATVDENGKVTFLAAGETCIAAETLNGLTDQCWFTVYAVEGSLQLNTEYTLEYTGFETRAETQRHFSFTPEKTGYYRLYSYDIYTEDGSVDIDPRCWVYDEIRNELEYDDDGGEDVNVSAQAALTAGETYYFMLELYDSEAIGSLKYKLEEMITAESVTIDNDDLVMEQGESCDIYVTYSPENSWQEDYVVSSSDPAVVTVQDKTILAVGAGEATVTVTTDRGLTDSITVTVFALDKIELNTPVTLEGDADNYGGSARYIFTPTVSGRYTISSSEAIGENALVSVSVSDSYEQLRYNNSSNTFELTYELVAGETYYYEVSLQCEAETSEVTFVLTKEYDEDIPAAKLNTDQLVDITVGGNGGYHVFTPTESGLYALFSVPSETVFDTKVFVYNSDWELFYVNDDGAGDSQFRLEEEFTVGETYYVKSFFFSETDIGSFTMRIEPMFEMMAPEAQGLLKLGKEQETAFDGEHTEVSFTFLTDHLGMYSISAYDVVSDSEIEPIVTVYNSNNEIVASGTGSVVTELSGLYVVVVSTETPDATASFKVKVNEAVAAESVTIDGGDVTLEKGESKEITVTYAPDGSIAEGFTVESSDENVVTVNGTTITAVGGGVAEILVISDNGLRDSIYVTVTVTVKGDVNDDTVLDSADVRVAMLAVLEMTELTEEQQEIADMNGDGKVNSADIREMLKALVTE